MSLFFSFVYFPIALFNRLKRINFGTTPKSSKFVNIQTIYNIHLSGYKLILRETSKSDFEYILLNSHDVKISKKVCKFGKSERHFSSDEYVDQLEKKLTKQQLAFPWR